MGTQRKRKTGKILGIIGMCAGVAAGGLGVATAPDWLQTAVESEAGTPQRTDAGLGSAVVTAVELGITPLDGAREVNPAVGPSVKAVHGTLKDVELMPAAGGKAVRGTISADGSTWSTLDPLEFNTEYRYGFTVVDGAGRETRKTQSFTTVSTANEANAVVFPRDGSIMGSGQPIEINFSEPVADKAAMEEAVKISVSSGQEVAWRWYSDRKVRIRPEAFWAADTRVAVDLPLFGRDFGSGMIGNSNVRSTFTTGPQRIAVVDDATKAMKVYFDGALVKTAPVTLGSPDWLSPTGYAVIMEQERHSRFNAGSIGLKPGDKGYYAPLVVEHANRLTNSGVYVHQALPSAYGAVGVDNVSHGCVGLLPDDAAWFFNNMRTGDVVQVLNTGAPAVEPLEGFGDWNIDWTRYAKR
ncbi:Ig-like domain-containing protein [Arthrobacter sp. efr-133-R2A-63]|uniref:L,D-transpeptidase n=1 Tax=Arthrobacter sp. efr-133-R2A-63 TaxID=3040278 RepID=UPI00254AF938|nr:Ig-like domain-containing protein [Arthrobacter sp. efr-133-R2A-63]